MIKRNRNVAALRRQLKLHQVIKETTRSGKINEMLQLCEGRRTAALRSWYSSSSCSRAGCSGTLHLSPPGNGEPIVRLLEESAPEDLGAYVVFGHVLKEYAASAEDNKATTAKAASS